MVDALFPADVIVTIDGSVLTTQLETFDESGGELNPTYSKTYHRAHKYTRMIPVDWKVAFSGTITGSDFIDLFNKVEEPFDVSLAWTGSYTLAYTAVRSVMMKHRLAADDRLLFDISFSVPFYDFTGSESRVVS